MIKYIKKLIKSKHNCHIGKTYSLISDWEIAGYRFINYASEWSSCNMCRNLVEVSPYSYGCKHGHSGKRKNKDFCPLNKFEVDEIYIKDTRIVEEI